MHGYKMKVLRGWKKTKSDLFGIIFTKYQVSQFLDFNFRLHYNV